MASLVVPGRKEFSYGGITGALGDLKQLLEQGFDVKWKVDTSHCKDCEKYGDRCGFDVDAKESRYALMMFNLLLLRRPIMRVHRRICQNTEFGRSLFERLVILGHKKHLLNVQYRMHPKISLFQNNEFYEKKIMDGPNVKSKAYEKKFLKGGIFGSYSFINVSSRKEELDDHHSTRDKAEVLVAALHKGVTTGKNLGLFCFSEVDAEALCQVTMDPSMRNGSRVVPVALNKVLPMDIGKRHNFG